MPKNNKKRIPKPYKSMFEFYTAKYLEEAGIEYQYETESLEYWIAKPKARCEECGSEQVSEQHWYTPDFILPNGIYVETKGKFTSRDRTKLVAVKESHPELDLRIVFSQDNWLTRAHKQRYSQWAEKHGFKYAIGRLPEEWLHERG